MNFCCLPNRMPRVTLLLLVGMMFGLGAPARAGVASPLDGFSPSMNGDVQAMALQPDGKVLVGGNFTTINGTTRNYIARLNADGSLDTTFDSCLAANFTTVWSLIVQSNGKVVALGTFRTYPSSGTVYGIARLNTNGSLDTSFNLGSGPNNNVMAVVQQSDGKLLLGGMFTSFNGTPRNGIARLNADGSLDDSYNPDYLARPSTGEFIRALALQPDGKLLVGGSFDSFSDGLARLNVDGSMDWTFGVGGPLDSSHWVASLAVQADGKVLVGGNFNSISNSNGTVLSKLVRLNADGLVDTSFNGIISGASSRVNALAVQPDGKLLVAGDFYSINGTGCGKIARLNADGSLDTTFNPGSGANAPVNALVVQADGNVLLGGGFSTINGTGCGKIARLNADGSLEGNFNPGTGANAPVHALAQQPDGKLLMGGEFSSVNGTARGRIARLNADGSLDTTFNPGTGADATVHALALQADGKILLAGQLNSFNGTACGRIARLNANGSLDATFNPGLGASATVNALALQADGKVLLGGDFTTIDGMSRSRIARLNADGSLDTTFDPGLGANTQVHALALQPDGKVLLGGGFNGFNGVTRNCIARLNANGSLDTTFNPGSGANLPVRALALQPDGKVLVGGVFDMFDGMTRYHLARLNANGTLDTAFDAGSILSHTVLALALQANGKVLLGGLYQIQPGMFGSSLLRLNTDGSHDINYDVGTGENGDIRALALQSDGKLLVGGSFTSINSTATGSIARLSNPDGAWQDLKVATGGSGVTWPLGGSTPQFSRVLFEHSADGADWSPLGWGVAVPGEGYRLSGDPNLPTKVNHFVRGTGWAPDSRGGNGLCRSMRLFNAMQLRHTLTYIAGAHGSIDGKTSVTQTLDRHTSGAAVSAMPATGYHFVQWSDGRTNNPRTEIDVTTDTRVTAAFAINQYKLTYIAGAHGSINGATSTTKTVNHGTNGTAVTAVPAAGYRFIKWTRGTSYYSNRNPLTVTNVMESLTLVAVFGPNSAAEDWTLYD